MSFFDFIERNGFGLAIFFFLAGPSILDFLYRSVHVTFCRTCRRGRPYTFTDEQIQRLKKLPQPPEDDE